MGSLWKQACWIPAFRPKGSYQTAFVSRSVCMVVPWCSCYHYWTTSFNTVWKLRFCADSNPSCNVSEIWDGENLWQWSWLEVRLNDLRLNKTKTIYHHQFIITQQAGYIFKLYILLNVLKSLFEVIHACLPNKTRQTRCIFT